MPPELEPELPLEPELLLEPEPPLEPEPAPEPEPPPAGALPPELELPEPELGLLPPDLLPVLFFEPPSDLFAFCDFILSCSALYAAILFSKSPFAVLHSQPS